MPVIIREAQIQVFVDECRSAAERDLADQCREYAPRFCQAAGEAGIREAAHTRQRLRQRWTISLGFRAAAGSICGRGYAGEGPVW